MHQKQLKIGPNNSLLPHCKTEELFDICVLHKGTAQDAASLLEAIIFIGVSNCDWL